MENLDKNIMEVARCAVKDYLESLMKTESGVFLNENARSGRFMDNLLKHKNKWLFQFVMNPDVEPTNNRAESGLRSSVIFRNASGGSRSRRGAKIYTSVYSIYYTSKLRGKNFISDTLVTIRRGVKPG